MEETTLTSSVSPADTANFWEELHNRDYLATLHEKKTLAQQLLSTERKNTESLNGHWNYFVDPYDWGVRQRFYERPTVEKGLPYDHSFDSWPAMMLPCCWNTQKKELLYYESGMIFTRTFSYQARSAGERVFLRFQGCNYALYLFLNGHYVGCHFGGSTPFNFEITPFLKEDNRIYIHVESSRSPARVPTDNTDWFNYGGIYRDIEFLRTPALYIKDLFVALKDDAHVYVEASVAGGKNFTEKLSLQIKGLGKWQLSLNKDGKLATLLTVQPRRWSPESPHLYEIEASFQDDVVYDRVGFRLFSVKERQLFLNGEPLLLKGVSVHEDHPRTGKSTDKEQCRKTLELIKHELGGNFVRLAHYPHDRQMSRLADEIGLLVWAEIPVYWSIDFANPSTLDDAKNQLEELILRDRNRCSVVIWSIGNENPDTDARLFFMSQLAQHARQLDNTRALSAACLFDQQNHRLADRLSEHIDIIGLNEYFGWYMPDFEQLYRVFENSEIEKPIIISECGAGALAGHHGSIDELFTEEHQQRIYEQQGEAWPQLEGLVGCSPWILYDFRTPHRMNRFQQGYNRKGLLDEDRQKRKKAFYTLQKIYRSWTLK